MRFNSLATKVSLYMTGVALAGGLLTSVGAYFIYALIAAQKPEWLADQTGGAWYPIDSVILCALILLGLSLSAVVSVMFTRRLLQPLTSLATTARQIQEGDLGARARAERGVGRRGRGAGGRFQRHGGSGGGGLERHHLVERLDRP